MQRNIRDRASVTAACAAVPLPCSSAVAGLRSGTAMLGRLRQIRSHVSTAAAETGVQVSAAFDGGNIEARPHSPFPTLAPLPLCPPAGLGTC